MAFSDENINIQDQFFTEEINNQVQNKEYKFLFCIKFDRSNSPNDQFLNAAKQFVDLFGERGVHSMVIVAIQEKNALCREDFLQKMKQTDGYEYLINNLIKSSETIPVCLWENNKSIYPNQKQFLFKYLNQVSTYEFIDASLMLPSQNHHQKEIQIDINKLSSLGNFFFVFII